MNDRKVSMKSKYFSELSAKELYEILKARAEIFVVGQNCVYQDLDGADYESLHVFFEESRKDVSAFKFGSGLYNVFNGNDPYGLAWSCYIK